MVVNPKKPEFRVIEGYRIFKSGTGWTVDNGTRPVKERHFRGKSVDHSKLKCFDEKTGRYVNVEHFQPMVYDLDDPMPKYNPRWEVWNGTGKNKKLIRIEFPPSYVRYWEKHAERMVNGYEVGGVRIPGPYYFFLNVWRIKSKASAAGWIVPRFIDVGKMFFDYIEQAKADDKNLMALKRRQIGFSEMCAAMAGWEYTFKPTSETLIIAGEGTYAENTTQKTRTGLNEFHRDASNTADPLYKRRLIDTLEETKSGYELNGVKRGWMSRLLCITTGGNNQRASGKSPSLVIFEESGRFQNIKSVNSMIQPSLEEGGSQNGRMSIFIGTGGEMDKGVAEMQEMFYDAEPYNLLEVPNVWDENVDSRVSTCSPFFPAWLYYVTDYDGNSYREPGMALIKERREKLKNKPDALHEFKTQMPLTPAEAFSVSGLSPFNVVKLGAQETAILGNKWNRYVQRGRYDWVLDDRGAIIGTKWTGADDPSAMDDDGDLKYPVLVWEHPDKPTESAILGQEPVSNVTLAHDSFYKNLYCGGTDPYDKDVAEWSDSLGSSSIFKGIREDNISGTTAMMFVARLTWRPIKAEKFYEMTARLHFHYHAENLIEWSNIGIFNWYQKNGWQHLLKERPLLAQAVLKDSKVNNRYGIDPHTKQYWEDNYAAYIEDYSANMYDLEQIRRAKVYRRKLPNGKRYNCDITISSMLAYQHFLDNQQRRFKVIESDAKKKKQRHLHGTYRDSNGNLRKVA